MSYRIIIIPILFCLFSCANRDKQEKPTNNNLPTERNLITFQQLTESTFYNQMLSNAALSSLQASELTFQQTEIIDVLVVQNVDKASTT